MGGTQYQQECLKSARRGPDAMDCARVGLGDSQGESRLERTYGTFGHVGIGEMGSIRWRDGDGEGSGREKAVLSVGDPLLLLRGRSPKLRFGFWILTIFVVFVVMMVFMRCYVVGLTGKSCVVILPSSGSRFPLMV
jgi:hypothetical protein